MTYQANITKKYSEKILGQSSLTIGEARKGLIGGKEELKSEH